MKTRQTLFTPILALLLLGGLLSACSSGEKASESEATESTTIEATGAGAAVSSSASRDLPLDPVPSASPRSEGAVMGGRSFAGKASGGAPMAAGAVATDDFASGGESIGYATAPFSSDEGRVEVADLSEVEVSHRKIAPDGVSGEIMADRDREIIEPEEIEPEPLPKAGQLTAGEWSDLREWDFWSSVIEANDWKRMADYWGFSHGTRISVRVDNGREPIVDAVVTLFDKAGKKLWETRSDNHGRAELFTGLEEAGALPPYDIVVEAEGKKTTLGNVDPSREQSMSEAPLVARIAAEADDPKRVDVMFAIDATGSMGDELRYIKAELGSVIERVEKEFEGQDVKIRLGANVYRDEGDEYLLRTHELTEKTDDVVDFLYEQSAGGGGDTPEAVEVALEDAIEKHEWSDAARARLLFLVLDAPPHYTEDRLAKIRELTRRANELGIRIIPLSSSGVDKETEFLMRFLGIHTGGTYTFLTDHSGIGNSHIAPTIGSYEVEYLDDLIVRLIVQYTDRPESLDAITPRTPEIH